MKRIEQINAYLQQGKTYKEIGKILGVSKQRVEQLVKRSDPAFSKFVYRRPLLKLNGQYRQEGNFLKMNEWYDFTLTEEVRPKSKNKLCYYLEINHNNQEIKITYSGLEALLKDFNNLNSV